jgi:hypothetical protein
LSISFHLLCPFEAEFRRIDNGSDGPIEPIVTFTSEVGYVYLTRFRPFSIVEFTTFDTSFHMSLYLSAYGAPFFAEFASFLGETTILSLFVIERVADIVEFLTECYERVVIEYLDIK